MYIYQIKKFHKDIFVGLGTDKFNPSEAKENSFNILFCKVIYVNYDGEWYRTNVTSILSFVHDLKNKTYNKEQLEEKIINALS